MKKTIRAATMTLACSALLCAPLSAELLRFKMTNETRPLPPGFVRVTPHTAYTKARGHGWTRGERVEWRKLRFGIGPGGKVLTGTFPDAIVGDWVAPGKCVHKSYAGKQYDFRGEIELRVDLPPGKYTTYLILGDNSYLHGYVQYLRQPFGVSINGQERVSVSLTDEQIAEIFFRYEYVEYDPSVSYWQRYVKPRCERTTYKLDAVSDGSIRIAVRNTPIAMLAIWPQSENGAAEQWLRELEVLREESCELAEAERPDVPPFASSPEQRQQGYVVFVGDVMEDITPYTVPDTRSVEKDLKLFAAANEYESATFGIYPLKQLNGVRVRVSDLTNEEGTIFPNRNIDVRFAKYVEQHAEGAPGLRYVLKPALLVAWDAITVHEGVTRQCWLTFHVPEDTPPGTYRGTVTVTPANAPSTTKNVLLKVLPFRLRTLAGDDRLVDLTISYIYPRHRLIWPSTPEAEMSRKLMSVWGSYGFNLAQTDFSVIRKRDVKLIDGEVKVDLDHCGEWLKGWEAAGVEVEAVVFSNWLNSYTQSLIKKRAPGYRTTKNEVKVFPKEYDPVFMKLAQAVARGFRERGWPAPVFYEGGEGGGYVEGRYFEKHVHGLCRKAGVLNSLSLSGSMDYFREIVPLVWAPFDYHFSLEKYEWMKERNLGIFYKAKFNRFERGLFFWRIDAKGHHAETFCTSGFGDPYDAFHGTYGSAGLAGPSRDHHGINPRPVLERHVREGHDDARYLFHLEWLIRRANGTKNAEVQAAADRAKQVLDRIRDTINPDLEYYRSVGGYPSNSVYQKIRWRVAREIMRLGQALANGEGRRKPQ